MIVTLCLRKTRLETIFSITAPFGIGKVYFNRSLFVLLVGNMLQPVDCPSIELFLDGDVRHGGGWRPSVPVLFARREPDHVAGTDFLDRSALALHATAAGGDDQGLPQRVGVPCRPGPRLECDT